MVILRSKGTGPGPAFQYKSTFEGVNTIVKPSAFNVYKCPVCRHIGHLLVASSWCDLTSCWLVFSRIRGHVPGSEDVPLAEAPRELALMMNGSSMGLR